MAGATTTTTINTLFPANTAMSLLSRAIARAQAPPTITGRWLPFGEAAAVAPADNRQAVVLWSPAAAAQPRSLSPSPSPSPSPPALSSPVWAPSPPNQPRAGEPGFLEALDRALEVAKAEIDEDEAA